MEKFEHAETVVDGLKLKDWLKSDEGLVDYERCKFGVNVSNTKGTVIFDLGLFKHDPDVGITTYFNGIDLARAAACAKFNVPYDTMRFTTALEGDDYVRIFHNTFTNPTIEDFVLYFYQLLDGYLYISETNHHVFVKGRTYTKEEWEKAVDELYSRSRFPKKS